MFGQTPLERAFLKDMLAYGIPVTEEADMLALCDALADATTDLDFYDVVLENNKLIFSNKVNFIQTLKKFSKNKKISLKNKTKVFKIIWDYFLLILRVYFNLKPFNRF